MIRSLAVLLLLASSLAGQIYSPKVLREGQVDTTSLAALAEGIYRNSDAQTEREKAEAIWRFFLTDGRFVEPGRRPGKDLATVCRDAERMFELG